MEKVNIREDLNDIVSKIKFEEVGSKNFKRMACVVTLFTGKQIEFSDKEGIYDLFVSYSECGEKDFIKSVRLVEEEKKNAVSAGFDIEEDKEDTSSTYICVLYTLKNGKNYRLFPAKKFVRDIIDNYYKKFKQESKEKQSQLKQQLNK